jgi:uncharacterized protein YukE
MANILIKPNQLRSTAQTLNQKAKNIQNAINAVERDINDLNSIVYVGNRASSLKTHYSQVHNELLSASNLIQNFARELQDTATLFDKADLGNGNGSPITPRPTPTLLPINLPLDDFFKSPRSNADFERFINTMMAVAPLIVKKAFESTLGKFGLGIINDIKDVYDLLTTGGAMKEVDLAAGSWQDAISQFGESSPEAAAAYDAYITAYEKVPFIGDIIKAAIDMGKANPVISE